MEDLSTTSNDAEQALHNDDTQVENLDVLQPGESPPRSIGMATKSRGAGTSSNNKGGKPPVPTRVDIADRPIPPISIKADTPKKREASRQNDVLVEKMMKGTRIGEDTKLGAILRRVNPDAVSRQAPVEPSPVEESSIDIGTVAIGVAGLLLIGTAAYFLIKSMSGNDVSAASSAAAAASAAVQGNPAFAPSL